LSSSSKHSYDENDTVTTICIVGGGWAGFSAAQSLSTCDTGQVQIHLLDASPRGPGGLAAAWRTPLTQRPVEAGLHGFWREYRNTFRILEHSLGLEVDQVLTNYTPSVLVSSTGRVALAPVLGDESSRTTPPDDPPDLSSWLGNPTAKLLPTLAALLPPPLDVALLEYDPKSPLNAVDRLSGLGLLGAWADFGQEDADSWERYDNISADNLLRSVAGVSEPLYEELLAPLLHVLPMTPGYDCSAAAALSCFHVFALQARGAFDVRWCRGSLGERIFDPWVKALTATGQVEIRGSAKVTSIVAASQQSQESVANNSTHSQKKYTVETADGTSLACDAVILAVGGVAAGRLSETCPPLAQVAHYSDPWKRFRGVTCVAVRLFLSALPADLVKAMKDSPVTVCGPKIGNIPALVETGFCIYDLSRLQDEFAADQEMEALEVDFYRADALAALPNEQIQEIALQAVASALQVSPLDPTLVVEVAVVRAPNAVSHFFVGSAALSPPVKLTTGLYMAGDWIDRKGHASWSTEKAVVTGRQAVAALSDDFGLIGCDTEVIAAAVDTAALTALRRLARGLRQVTPALGFPLSPWQFLARIPPPRPF
jgi:uncharacterized protein with NAD-binding domain and iron-sulfur cluster